MTDASSSDEQRLVLVRHAKSSHPAGLDDHERPLDERGWVDAPALGQRLVDAGWTPDVVLCSTAVRAQATWQRMASAFGPVPVEVSRRLYLAGVDALEDVLSDPELLSSGRAAPVLEVDDARCVFVVGHNPGWEEVARQLSGVEVQVPTATAVLLRRREPRPWSAGLGVGGWDLVGVLRAGGR